MWKNILIWFYICGYCTAGPFNMKRNMPIIQREEEPIAAAMENEANKPEAVHTAVISSDEAAAPPNIPMISTLTLPSNATSIRADITDGFSCANKPYGYYADVENDCQIFHVCLPVTYADGRENTFRWSFICPEDTIFSQDSFTCMRHEDMSIDCEESSKYYELNRNFGMIEEENNKNIQNSESSEQHLATATNHGDQLPAMTQHFEEKQPQKPQRQPLTPIQPEQPIKPLQTLTSDEQVTKPESSIFPLMPQKQKPSKLPKPNRRKPVTASLQKKKPIRKTTLSTTAPQIETVTIISTLAEESETKPTSSRFTKRPSISNLKEKIQSIPTTDTIPIRIELYNQKRKRPALLNKKDSTTSKPIEDQINTTEQPNILDTVSTKATATFTDPEPANNNITPTDHVAPQASETSAVFVKPETTVNLSDSKKVSKPQPTEPELPSNPTINLEEMPTIKPLEAFEEIPAVITEVEEINTNKDQKMSVDTLTPQVASIEEEHIVDENKPTNIPAILQQNSEESLPSVAFSIEEMEDQKPADAPEIILPSPDMVQQHPLIEQMFPESDSEANKQSMGGFKPVDPAEAAEAEALIANFLNTLMKSDQVNASPITPATLADIKEHQITVEKENSDSTQNTNSQNFNQEKAEKESQETSQLPTIVQPELPTTNNDLLPSIMMMHDHPGDVFQIPVQVIQTPIEELKASASISQAKPVTVDNVVELVKKQLDQNPTPEEPLTENIKTETNDKTKFQKLGEELILPIYQRVSSEPKKNMIKATNEKKSDTKKPIENINKNETQTDETEKNSTTPTTEQVKSKPKSKNGRSERARSIKTVSKMDPRKRKFLFRSDVS